MIVNTKEHFTSGVSAQELPLVMGQLHDLINQLNFGIKNDEIIQKALEYERLMTMKVINLKKAENARTPIAIEFACKTLYVTVPRDTLVRFSGLRHNEYLQAVQKCKSLMGLKFENLNTIEVFGFKYSGEDTAKEAYAILEAYKQEEAKINKYEQLPDYDSALYQGAAFVVASRITKLKTVPKRDVFFETLDLPSKAIFNKMCNSMEAISKKMSSTSYQEVGTIPPHLETKIEDPLEDATMNFVENPSGNAKVFHFPATLNECQSRPAGAIIPELKHEVNSAIPKKRNQSDIQFNNARSVQLREAAEKEATEKKRKNLEIYSSWKSSVLRKRNLEISYS